MPRIRSISVSEARPRLAAIVEEVSQEGVEPYFIISRSKVKAVLLGIEEYNYLMDRLEDLYDIAEIYRQKLEGDEEQVPWEEVKAKLDKEFNVSS